ncbi:MAG: hypothetical protein OEZ34_06405 [Spirochaetia bacterium]|nr:hypothetical protein [Spirochaetia bacterium]
MSPEKLIFIFIISIAFLTSAGCSENTLTGAKSPSEISIQSGWKIEFENRLEFSYPEYSDLNWQEITPGSSWESQGFANIDGTVWYRIQIAKQDLKHFSVPGVNLGKIDDVDETYFNGKKIGGQGKAFPQRNPKPDQTRIYIIPPHLISNVNVLAVRVTDTGGEGGLKIGSPSIGNYPDLIAGNFIKSMYSILFAAVFMLTGLYGLLFYIHQRKKTEYMLFFGIAFCISLIVINESEIRYYLHDSYFFWNHLKLISVFLLGPLFLRYFKQIFFASNSLRDKIYEILTGCMIAALLLNAGLIRWRVIPDNEIHDFIAFFIWFPSLGYFFFAVFIIMDGQFKKKNFKAKIFSMLFLLLLGSLLIDALLIITFNRYESTMLEFGFFIFLFGIVFTYSDKFSRMQFFFDHYRIKSNLASQPMNENIKLRIHCFGKLEVIDEIKGNISGTLTKTRSRLKIFQFLIVNFGKGIHREEICEFLWPDLELKKSSQNLNSQLSRLRKMFSSSDIILEENGIIMLNPSIVETDFNKFEFLCSAASALIYKNSLGKADNILQQIKKIYTDDFFAFDPNFDPAVRMNDNFALLFRKIFLAYAKSCLSSHETEKAISTARLLIEKDQTDEESWIVLIESLALSGNKSRALSEYRKMTDILKKEFNVLPDIDLSSIDSIK